MDVPEQVKAASSFAAAAAAASASAADDGSRRRLRVCMLTTTYPRFEGDGVGSFVSGYAEYMHAHRGCEVHVYAPASPELPDRQVIGGVPVFRLRYFWPKGWQRLAYGAGIPWNLKQSRVAKLNLPFFVGAFAAVLATKARQYDLVHAHWGVVGALAVATRPIHRRPVVLNIHGTDLRTPDKVVKAMTRYAIRNVDAVMLQSTEFHRWCCEMRPDDWSNQFIAPGVATPGEAALSAKLAEPPTDAPRLVTVGRLVAERRHDLLVRAFAEAVLPRWPTAKLRIVGDGPARGALEQQVRQLGLGPDKVEFTGAVDHKGVSRNLLESDLYVSPTTIENFGYSVVEAASHGLPAVTTRVGFPGELVISGQTGHVVEPADYEALRDAILDCLSDPARLRAMGRASVARFDELGLSWERSTLKALDVYRRCIAARQR